MISTILYGLGLVLVIEGLVYVLAPHFVEKMLVSLKEMPIGATQLGWYLYDKQTGFDYGMIVGTVSVIYAAYLMYEKNWREEDED